MNYELKIFLAIFGMSFAALIIGVFIGTMPNKTSNERIINKAINILKRNTRHTYSWDIFGKAVESPKGERIFNSAKDVKNAIEEIDSLRYFP